MRKKRLLRTRGSAVRADKPVCDWGVAPTRSRASKREEGARAGTLALDAHGRASAAEATDGERRP